MVLPFMLATLLLGVESATCRGGRIFLGGQVVSITNITNIPIDVPDPYAQCPTVEQAECASLAGKPAIAISIVGVKQRMLFNSTVDNVVKSIAEQGFAVHVYISLVDLSRVKGIDTHNHISVRVK